MKNLYILVASILILNSISCVDFAPTGSDNDNLSFLLKNNIAELVSGPANVPQFKIFLNYKDGNTRVFVLKRNRKSGAADIVYEGWKLFDLSGDKAHTLLPKEAPANWLKLIHEGNKFFIVTYTYKSNYGETLGVARDKLDEYLEFESKMMPEFFPQGFKPQIDAEGNFIIK